MNIVTIFIMPCIYSFLSSFAFGVQFNIRSYHIFLAAIGGIISQLVYSAMSTAGVSDMVCYFTAACAITFYSECLAKLMKTPINMYLVISLIPLVPGGAIYNAMITLVNGNFDAFLHDVVFTLGIAGSIAMGVFAISTVFRVIGVAFRVKK